MTIEKLKEENKRLQNWVNDLQSGMYINCVYCGHQYGPRDNTPVSMADVLKEHIEICPQHPMSALKKQIAALDAENKQLKSTAVCVYCGAVQVTKDGQTKMEMIIDHMAVCEKHPVANLLVKVERLTAEKKELVKGLEAMARISDL